MILSAGLGTRLRPLTDSLPKPLVPVAGRPMIAYVLDALEEGGFEEVLVNVHYLADQMEAFAKAENKKRKQLRIEIQDERKQILGSGGAIALGASWLFAKNSLAVVFNADSFMQPNLKDLVKTHSDLVKRKHVLCTLAAMEHEEAGRRYTGLVVKGDLISGFVNPDPKREEDSFHFPGVYCIEKAAVEYLDPPGNVCSIMEKLWAPLAREGRLGAWKYEGRYQDLGTVEDLKKAERFLTEIKD